MRFNKGGSIAGSLWVLKPDLSIHDLYLYPKFLMQVTYLCWESTLLSYNQHFGLSSVARVHVTYSLVVLMVVPDHEEASNFPADIGQISV